MLSLTHLPNQKKGEHTAVFLRRHWFAVFKIIFLFIILAAAPPIVFLIVSFDLIENGLSQTGTVLIILLGSAYYLFVWLFAFHEFVDYYLDVWIVTNKRILNIEQKGIFARTISEQKLDRIQDITSEIHGIIPTFLQFGDLHVQTAAEKQRFIFKQIPRPDKVRKKIIGLVEQYRSEHPSTTTRDQEIKKSF